MNQNFDQSISMDEEYIPNKKSHSHKPRVRKPKTQNDNSCNSNKWSITENRKFLQFIKANIDLLNCQFRRKQEKVFLQLSKQVGTRSADQCRSHHQKMIKHHSDLQGIIAHLQVKLGEREPEREQLNEVPKFQQRLTIPAIKQAELPEMIRENFETALEIELIEPKQEPKKQEDIWGLLEMDVWMGGQAFFSPFNL